MAESWKELGKKDPKYQKAYDTLLQTPRPATPAELRAIYSAAKSANGNSGSSYEDNGRIIAEDISIPLRDGTTTKARLHRSKKAATEPAPLAVIIHGGGYITGDRFDESWTCQILVEEIGAVALAIEYRRAPEYPFPTAIHDAWDAVKWAAESAETLGADPTKAGFIVGGNSAGGNLATVIGYLAKQENFSPSITGLAIQVPVISGEAGLPEHLRPELQSYAGSGVDAPIMNSNDVRMFLGHYNPDLTSPLFNPWAHGVDLSEYPPVFFQIAGMDPLRDEGLLFERHLRQEYSVATQLKVYSALPHAFWFIPLPEFADAIEQARLDYRQGVRWLVEQTKSDA
ncbi:Ab hydrolase superfamily protein [Lasiodiplodia theobromae]|uniref:Ab hydrolase superfamily protein n=1 Tax=Lasiodiplodia theobromae TaxID=45133 RepID=UPI0015C37FF8|nr:Ab hydrolase superfamily protein [Lasiodiplodia theobromae]KAF4540350.1 Ab hydrolase superfamily protein [Lasiodiplodia theobromae]